MFVRVSFTVGVGSIYWLMVAGRPLWIFDNPLYDEALFLREAMTLVAGSWLGPYNAITLVKGAGYPIFIAVNHLSGVSLAITQSALYFVACAYMAHVIGRLLRSNVMFVVLLIALLLCPIMYEQSMQRLLRDHFYTSLTLIYFAALLDATLAGRSLLRSLSIAALAGLVGGTLWITREETIWLLPPTALALLFCFFRSHFFNTALHAVAVLASALLVCIAVAAGNYAAYGVFILNEIKDGDFQAAMTALQRGSYSYRQPYLPVPRPARAKLYEVSPSFGRLKPYLETGPQWIEAGCPWYPNACGDIAGGWFVWALRDAAGRAGMVRTAVEARAFYRAIAEEVDAACERKIITCGGWIPPYMPGFMEWSQLKSLPQRSVKAASFISMLVPIGFTPLKSEIEQPDRILSLLNYPLYVGPLRTEITLLGWYRGVGDQWFTVDRGKVERLASSDLISAFSDDRLHHQRFKIVVSCADPCDLSLHDEANQALTLNLLDPSVIGGHQIGDGMIYIDVASSPGANPLSIRERFFTRWLRIVEAIHNYIPAVMISGALAYVAILFLAPFRRFRPRLALCAMIASILVAGIVSRTAALTVADAVTLPALQYNYLAPSIPIALAAAVVSIFCLPMLFSFQIPRERNFFATPSWL
jgi:hypothetical protein